MVSVTLTLGEWLYIDAVLDNVHAMTAFDLSDLYDPKAAATAIRIREIGWGLERPLLEGRSWPPGEETAAQPITVPLTESDWRFALEVLEGRPEPAAKISKVILAALANPSA